MALCGTDNLARLKVDGTFRYELSAYNHNHVVLTEPSYPSGVYNIANVQPHGHHTLGQEFNAYRSIKYAVWDPSWCWPYSEYNKPIARFFIHS